MNLRSRRSVSAAVVLIAGALCLTAPATAAAQRVPAKPALITLEAPAPPSAAPGGDASIPLRFADALSAGDPRRAEDASSALRGRLVDAERKSVNNRVLPYAAVGLVVGGLLGYAAHEGVFWDRDENACREQDIPGCELSPYLYTIAGAGFGFGVGALIGYIRERP